MFLLFGNPERLRTCAYGVLCVVLSVVMFAAQPASAQQVKAKQQYYVMPDGTVYALPYAGGSYDSRSSDYADNERKSYQSDNQGSGMAHYSMF